MNSFSIVGVFPSWNFIEILRRTLTNETSTFINVYKCKRHGMMQILPTDNECIQIHKLIRIMIFKQFIQLLFMIGMML